MSADILLAKLDGLKETGPGRYIARCPAHKDRSPSLSVRVLDDGRILVHCFASCDVADVVAAVGLTITDLFPDRPLTQTALAPQRLKLRPAEALLLLGHEITAACMLTDSLAAMMRAGEIPNQLGLDRLTKAAARIQRVRGITDAITSPEIAELRRGVK
jgi:hypothetical protein